MFTLRCGSGLLTICLGFFVVCVGTADAQNQINNPTFEEEISPSGLPPGFHPFPIPSGAYESSVVAGGHTGEHSLMIEGDGRWGIVGMNVRTDIDLNKQYAARGWIRLEGEPGTQATIKFDYFDDDGFVGSQMALLIQTSDMGWHEVWRAADLSQFPTATRINLAAALNGKGKAWFDDLEFYAYDKQDLPEDFAQRYARQRSPAMQVLQQWVGTWICNSTIRMADGEPNEETFQDAAAWVLDDKFLQIHAVGDSGPRSQFLCTYDASLGKYRSWYFDIYGNASEADGTWDEETRTMTWSARDLEPGQTSLNTVRFLDDDTIEVHVRLTDADGDTVFDFRSRNTRQP